MAYLDELEWRFNDRDNAYLFRDTLESLASAGEWKHEALIAD